MNVFWFAVGIVFGVAIAPRDCHAHALKPGECVSFATDAERFMKVKALGYSADEAEEMLRQMFQDQGWFTYVQDKDDVQLVRTMVDKVWQLPDDATPEEMRQGTLNECDPDNEEQYEIRHKWTLPHGA